MVPPFSQGEMMKLFGQQVLGPNVETLVLPRAEFDIIITAQAILDDTPFYDMCPRPKAPKVHKPGQAEYQEDRDDPDYLKTVNRWAEQRSAWTILESLKATPKDVLEWEVVNYSDPLTWTLWQKELKDAFFPESEIIQIMRLVWGVNGMSQEKLDEARNRFLAGQARRYNPPLSQKEEQPITPSGEPVKDFVSALPV